MAHLGDRIGAGEAQSLNSLAQVAVSGGSVRLRLPRVSSTRTDYWHVETVTVPVRRMPVLPFGNCERQDELL